MMSGLRIILWGILYNLTYTFLTKTVIQLLNVYKRKSDFLGFDYINTINPAVVLYCIVLYCVVLMGWSLLSNVLRPF